MAIAIRSSSAWSLKKIYMLLHLLLCISVDLDKFPDVPGFKFRFSLSQRSYTAHGQGSLGTRRDMLHQNAKTLH